ncbi:hypothetical protein TRAPUB_8325 [Trametes pubescens]|uniref:Uncharacterized protein n=1 Tax=Trametes pubescens TaxID=154538 RepID=A0A1M2W5D8_TRAPU|nr:hypothetical protein TRAPUB_8325 [Trametes pubescens]
MLTLADADREEARYQKLVESYTEARTSASSRARGYDVAQPPCRPLSEIWLEETVSNGQGISNVRYPAEDVLAVVDSLSPLYNVGCDALNGMELCVRPTAMEAASIPTHDAGGLSPIIESDSLATPSNETVPTETCPTDTLTASHTEVPLVRTPPSVALPDFAYMAAYIESSGERPQPQAFDIVWRNSNPVSNASSISRPSSPIPNGSEGPGLPVKRALRARRARTKTRSSSRSRASNTSSRRNTGDNNSKPDSAEHSVQSISDTVTLPAHDRPLVQAGPPPSSFVQRGRSPAPALSIALATTSSHASSTPPSRTTSPTPGGTDHLNPSPGSGLSRHGSIASTVGYGQYGDPDPGLHLPAGPHPIISGMNTKTRTAQNRFGPYHAQSHPSIYRDLVTAIGLSPAPLFQYTLLKHPIVPTSDNSNGGTFDADNESRRRPPFRGSALDDPELRAMEEGVSTGHDKGASDTLCDPHDPRDTKGRAASQKFPLKVFRRRDFKVLEIEKDWDDEMLLTALKKTYDQLRGWRKYFGLMSIA